MKVEYNREQRELTRAFRHTFVNNPDGEKVLKYLKREYGNASIDEENPTKMACGVGARNVIVDIENILERGDIDGQIHDEIPE